jgi:hypothetical protein
MASPLTHEMRLPSNCLQRFRQLCFPGYLPPRFIRGQPPACLSGC